MLSSLLGQKLANEGLSSRAAAKQIGVSHTTLLRALRGEPLDLSTVMSFAAWLGVELGDLVNNLDISSSSIGSEIAVALRGVPKLERAFADAMKMVRSGKVSPHVIEDIAAYASYRINYAEPRMKKQARGKSGSLPQTAQSS